MGSNRGSYSVSKESFSGKDVGKVFRTVTLPDGRIHKIMNRAVYERGLQAAARKMDELKLTQG